MAGEIFEWYGYRSSDMSHAAVIGAESQTCPFVPGPCTKSGGVCSVRPQASQEIIPVCPKRLYFDGHRFLREIADEAFPNIDITRGPDALPTIVPGNLARPQASESQHQVGVFGLGYAQEIKLPPVPPGRSRYSVDFTLVAVSSDGDLAGFVPVEVQTIDTTGNYEASMTALKQGRQVVLSGIGMNWENVNKRILPQLILKGLMLQGERRCTTGMYFVTPEPVFRRLMLRLGGVERLRRIPRQPGSITFLRYEHDLSGAINGSPLPMRRLEPITISTSDVSLAFITPQNLPTAGAYEAEILKKL